MYDFKQVTEVKLASGSHASPQDGLCFMEMVAWFQGEKHSDKPACACPVLGAYGIELNDRMPDDVRDRLLKPLVPLIAGTRGTRDDQRRRVEFLALWAINKVVPIALRAVGLEDHAKPCEQAGDLTQGRKAAAEVEVAAVARWSAAAAAAVAEAEVAAVAVARWSAAAVAEAEVAAVAVARWSAAVWEVAVEGLRQAILIGPHEGFTVTMDLRARHEALRVLVVA